MLREKLGDALKEALRTKDAAATSTVRLILAALKDRDIAARSKGNRDGVSEDDLLSLLQTMIKQRRESIAMYEQGGRQELADKERAEIGVIERFLPSQLDEAAMAEAVRQGIAATGAKSVKDLGGLMAHLKQKHAGKMDFARAAGIAKQALQG